MLLGAPSPRETAGLPSLRATRHREAVMAQVILCAPGFRPAVLAPAHSSSGSSSGLVFAHGQSRWYRLSRGGRGEPLGTSPHPFPGWASLPLPSLHCTSGSSEAQLKGSPHDSAPSLPGSCGLRAPACLLDQPLGVADTSSLLQASVS